jgi:hypothetical protein
MRATNSAHTFDKLDCHIRILFRIRSEQFAQKASSHRWLDTDAQTAGFTPTGLSGYSGRLLKLLKGFTSLLDKICAGVGDLEAVTSPFKQRRTEGVFELPQSPTH